MPVISVIIPAVIGSLSLFWTIKGVKIAEERSEATVTVEREEFLSSMSVKDSSVLKLGPEPSVESQLFTVTESTAEYAQFAKSYLSVNFSQVGAERLASIILSPEGEQSINMPVLSGYSIPFSSKAGNFIADITNVDFVNRSVALIIRRDG